MPLSPQEEAELAQLEAEVGPQVPYRPKNLAETKEALFSPKAMQERQKLSEDTVSAVGGSFMPQGTANPLSWLARKSGLSAIPDRLMQKAVGLKKYIPGVGDNLMEQGVRGTKAGMTGQVGSKITQQDDILGRAVDSIKGNINSAPVADDVAAMGSRYTTPGGITPQSVASEAEKVAASAQDIAGRGAVAPQEALKLKRIAGEVGYKYGEPLAKLNSRLAQKEGMGYGKALEEAYAQSVPNSPNMVAEANSKLSALLKAKKGLNAPESLASHLFPNAVLGGAGYAAGGNEGAGAAIAARYAAKSPLVQSYGAHALSKLGSGAAQASLRGAGMAAGRSNSRLSPAEESELEQLERELAGK